LLRDVVALLRYDEAVALLRYDAAALLRYGEKLPPGIARMANAEAAIPV